MVSTTWGSGVWGDGTWGINTTDRASYTPVIVDNWPFEQVYPDDDEAIMSLLVAYGVELDRLQEDIRDVGDATRLDLATDEELEQLAGEVGAARQTGESDDRLRERARIAKAVTRSDGTIHGLAAALTAVYGESVVSDMRVSTTSGAPVVQLNVPSTFVSDSTLTENELEAALDPILPSSDSLTIVSGDTLILGQSGSQGLGGELT